MVGARQLAQSYITLMKETDSPKETANSFVFFCREKGLENLLQPTVQLVERMMAQENESQTLKLEVAQKFSDETIELLKQTINCEPDTKVVVQENPNIIGGFLARYNNIEFDASIASKLRKALRM